MARSSARSKGRYAIEQSFYLRAPPERTFQALTDPKELVRWFLTKAKLDLREGGDYEFEWLGGYRLTGKVKRVEVGKAVSFSFGSGASTASFEMSRRSKGTLLRLRNGGIDDLESFATMAGRWAYYLTNLKSVLDHGIDLRSGLDWA